MKKLTRTLEKKLKSYNSKFKEECGVFGISNIEDASALTALGLHALQHRGQEGCGIVTFNGNQYFSEKRFGLVVIILIKKRFLKTFKVIMLSDTIDIAPLEKILLEIFSLFLQILMQEALV